MMRENLTASETVRFHPQIMNLLTFYESIIPKLVLVDKFPWKMSTVYCITRRMKAYIFI